MTWSGYLVLEFALLLDERSLSTLRIPIVYYYACLPVAMALMSIRFTLRLIELALLTPPIGLNLYVLSSISRAPLAEVIRGVNPFIILLLGLLILVTYVPEISTWLPNLVFE